MKRTIVTALFVAAGALAPAASAKVYVPAAYPDVRVEKDLRYGSRRGIAGEGFDCPVGALATNEWGFAKNGHATGQDYDIYTPAAPRANLPVFVYIHGGAWSWCYDKTDHEEFFEMIANDGWAVFAPNYILQSDLYNLSDAAIRPEATFDTMLRDIDLFMAEVKRVASERGYDARRIVIAGESAGGHLCSLYAYDAASPARFGLGLKHPLAVGLVFNIVGAVDFTDPNWLPTGIRTMGGDKERYLKWLGALMGGSCDASALEKYSVVPMVTRRVPEHLLSYSCRAGEADDGCIPVSNFHRLTNALARCGVPCAARLFEGTSHCETMQPPAAEAREWYLNELRRYRASLGFLDVAGISAEVEGRTVTATPVRLSAAPINKIFDGRQRDLAQTKAGAVLSFDFAKPCEMRILNARGFPDDLEIRPLSRANGWRREPDELVVQLTTPEQFVVFSRSGAMPDIHVFANAPFVAPKGPNVRRFPKGVHRPGVLAPKSGETIVIDEGAVVHAECFVLGATNVTITGRGILDFSEWERHDPRAVKFRVDHGLKDEDTELACNPFVIHSSENVRVEGITLKDAPFWTLVVRNGSRGVEIDNVKIVGNWRYNSDGINVCASEIVSVRDSFVRSFDDCLVARASYFDGDDGIPTRRLRFERNRLWCDWGKNCEVWAGHKPTVMEDIVFRDNSFLNVHFVGCDVNTWFCSDSTYIGEVTFDANEYDFGEARPETLFQSRDHELYRYRPMRKACLLEVSSWNPAKNLGNQHFGPADDESKYRLLYDGITFSDPRIYGGTNEQLAIKSETSTAYQHIRGVRCVDIPKNVWIETKGDVDLKVVESRAGRLATLWDSPDRHYVFVAAHRMDWRDHPENSIPGALDAIAKGVDVLEIDVKRTKDGVLVLSHDRKVDRCTDGHGKIADLTLAEIRALRLKRGKGGPLAPLTAERMPTFAEFLAAVKGKALVNVDQADWIGFRDVVETVERHGSLRETIFKGALIPDELRGVLGERYWQRFLAGEIRYMPVIQPWKADALKLRNAWVATGNGPREYELCLGGPGYELPAAAGIDVKAPNAPRVWINTLWDSLCMGHTDDRSLTDPEGGWDWVLARGASVIQTDRPAQLVRHLEAVGRR